ncbi:MAG TPA: Rieske (2Fe-2S) protein [Methylomirabilota bacterium]|nr:Rieske (2Fe-2S) protein [Methylomirabilota bacterium]
MSLARRVASLDEVPAGQPKLVELDGTRIVLARVGDVVYACGNVCTHRGGPLSEGKLNGTRLACPWHGWMYDIRTGQCVFPGRGASVPSYPVRLEADQILVELS